MGVLTGEAKLAPRFHGGPYGPGDLVEGAIVATEAFDDLRSLNLYLRYVDSSPSYSSGETHDSSVPFHQGPLAPGQEVPFAMRIPEDALPNWEDPRTQQYGTLAWALVMETDIAGGLDTVITRSIPVDRTGRTWPGPAPPAEPRVKGAVDDWDVSIEADNWSPQRGEHVTFTLRIGEPKPGRPIDLGFHCQMGYDVEVKHMRSGGDTDYVRETRWINLIEEKPPSVDTSLPEKEFRITIPPDAPWTYAGKAVGFVWKARVSEDRRWKRDPFRSAFLQVRP